MIFSWGLFSWSSFFALSSTFSSAGLPRDALTFWPPSNAVLNKAASIKIRYINILKYKEGHTTHYRSWQNGWPEFPMWVVVQNNRRLPSKPNSCQSRYSVVIAYQKKLYGNLVNLDSKGEKMSMRVLTDMIGANFQSLVASHYKPHFLGLPV